MRKQFELWLNEIIGKKLISVQASLFKFEGVVDYINPHQIKLDFGISIQGYITCSSDGYSLEFLSKPLDAFEMGDAGQRIIENLSEGTIFNEVVGKEIKKAIMFIGAAQSKPVCIGLYFDVGEIHLANLGDEIFVYKEYPESSFQDEDIRSVVFT